MGTIVPIILCGGSGTRLWPRSRRDCPKPFLPLLGDRSLFQQTLARFAGDDAFAAPIVVAGEAHRRLVEDQLGEASTRLIVEPQAKNTAPAIGLAAHLLDPDDVMLVCPSDHYIARPADFRASAQQAAALAAEGWLVSFGITPTGPETGYGYLERGEALGSGYRTARFVEKPDRRRAEQFLQSGNFLWNAGIFAFAAGRFRDELRRYRPDMATAVAEAARRAEIDSSTIFPAAEPFSNIEGESVDYAVMENTELAAMVTADIGWSDIGSWTALHAALGGDDEGNTVRGPAELVDCTNVLVDSDGPRVSAIGLEDVVIVVDGDEILVTTAASAQLVGKLSGASGQ